MAVAGLFAAAMLVAIARAPQIAESVLEWRFRRAVARMEYRATTGRLSGLDYAEHRPKASATERDPTISKVFSEVLRHSKSPHLRAKALLQKGDSSAAVELLREVSKSGDAEARSDLSAALLAQAEELGDWNSALDAVVAARKAIKASDLPAAHFNLGWMLDRLGLATEAAGEFQIVMAAEPQSGWAAEARKQLPRLSRQVTDWTLLEKQLLETHDEDARKRMLRPEAEMASRYGAGPFLEKWADFLRSGNPELADRYLGLSRDIGNMLAEDGDRFVADAVAGIDRARALGSQEALSMAEAVMLYRQGGRASSDGSSTAIASLSRAARMFAEKGSPLQYAARDDLSGAYYNEQRVDEALEVLESLAREGLDEKGYPRQQTQLGHNWASCLLTRGDYPEAFHQANRSYERSVTSGDRLFAAGPDGMAATALDYLGRPREAGLRRSRALREFSTHPRRKRDKLATLSAAANVQLAAREPARAAALLDYGVPLAEASAEESKEAHPASHAYAQRSMARDELGDRAGAEDDRKKSREWIGKIENAPGAKERAEADLNIAEGVARRVQNPAAAIAYFDDAIALLRSSGQTSTLPRLFLERARAHEGAGMLPEMRADLREGLAVVAGWESSAGDALQRAAIKVWSDALRRELVAAELTAGNVPAAFAAAEDRNSTSRNQTRLSLREVQAALAPGAAVLVLVTIRENVMVFIIRADSEVAETLPRATEIATAAESLRVADDEESFLAASRAMHKLILEPIRDHLREVTTLAVIPDRELTGIPFGSFYDGARFEGERRVVIHNDTAGDAIRHSQHARELGQYVQERRASFLSIGASQFEDPGAALLPSVKQEAQKVADRYRGMRPRVLLGEDATPQNVQEALLESPAGFHFGGHIVGRGTEARMLLAPSRGRDGLTAREISNLDLSTIGFAVLAACRGSSTSEPSAIVRDMATGFLTAGVATVIASATDVDDADSLGTMKSLHDFLSAGNADAAEALRQTVHAERADGKKVPLSVRLMVLGGTKSLVR